MANETVTQSPKQLLDAASADLAGVRGLLLMLAEHVEGEEGDGVYGITSLVELAKDKLDTAIGVIEYGD